MKRKRVLFTAFLTILIFTCGWHLSSYIGRYTTHKYSFTPKLASANAVDFPKNIDDQSSIAEKAVEAVVNISSIKIIQYQPYSPFLNDPFFRQFFGHDSSSPFGQPREYRERSLGSGVLVSYEGHILTNNHVIENATEISVRLNDQTEVAAELIGKDPQTDVALIKISPNKKLKPIALGDSDILRLAEPVLAIGSPFGLGGTVTMGIVSAKGRANVGIVDYEDFIQTDAAINPGNSGGALVNFKGELVGVNTAIFSKSGGYQGIGFAIPINMAKHVMDQLIKYGEVKRGWVGLRYQDVTPEIVKALGQNKIEGVIVTGVYPNGPADLTGFKRGDVIISYNGTIVKSSGHLSRLLSETPINQKATMQVRRDGKTLTFKTTIQSIPSQLQRR